MKYVWCMDSGGQIVCLSCTIALLSETFTIVFTSLELTFYEMCVLLKKFVALGLQSV